MPLILRRYADDETIPQPSGNPLDDGDWWPIHTSRMAGLVLAGAAALSGTSALARGLQQQDEAITQEVPVALFEEGWSAPSAQQSLTIRLFSASEDIVPQPAMGGGVLKASANILRWPQGDDFAPEQSTAIVETDGWAPPTVLKEVSYSLSFTAQDQIPVETSFEIEGWCPPVIRSVTVAPLFTWSEDVPPQPSGFVEETDQFKPDPQPGELNVTIWAENDDIVPGVVEIDPWPSHLQRSYQPPLSDQAVSNDQLLVPEPPQHEEYWYRPGYLTVDPFIWIGTAQEDIVPQPPSSIQFDEEPWPPGLGRSYQAPPVLWVPDLQDLPELSEPPVVVRESGAGKSKKRYRYIARFKGEDYEFSNLEDLEEFVAQAQKQEKAKPKKVRKPVKIRFAPEYQEEVSEKFDIPKLSVLPASKALEQVRQIEKKLKEVYDDDEEAIWLILTS